jgi:hypothetical protein
MTYVGGDGQLGCGIGRHGTRRYQTPDFHAIPERCTEWETTWAKEVLDHPTDLAIVMEGPWDAADRKVPGIPGAVTIGDAVYDEYLVAEMVKAYDVLASNGATVVWLTSPTLEPLFDQDGRPHDEPQPIVTEGRIAKLNAILTRVQEQRPGLVIVDFGAYLDSRPDAAPGGDLRPDGVHLTNGAALYIANEWLANVLIQVERSGTVPDP